MNISDLVASPTLTSTTSLHVDPTLDTDALQEAQLIGLQLDARLGVLALIFDMRVAISLRQGNTGLLVVRGARQIVWEAESRSTTSTAWNVMSSSTVWQQGGLKFDLQLWPDAILSALGDSAQYFALDAKGIGLVPPDYTTADEPSIKEQIAHWHTDATVVAVS